MNNTYQDTKDELDGIGKGFCAAKWTQVTMHLHNGLTHSCHHPSPHKIPLTEISRNYTALHNTQEKKKARKEMLNGERPKECQYCWNVEDNSSEYSDRVYKSGEPWSKPHIQHLKTLDWRHDYNPRYVEVSFSNICNFKCSYCGPSFSSTWMQEIKKHGSYPTTDGYNGIEFLESVGQIPINHGDYNPYVEAFWKWWPELYDNLDNFRITGGEPLMTKDMWKVLDFIIENPNPNKNLSLAINSNLGVPDELIDKFIEKVKKIEDEGRVKEIVLFTSIDTFGPQADYIRNGLNHKKWLENLHKIFSKTNRLCVTVMSTFNALSIFNYDKLIYEMYEMKQKYNHSDRYWSPALGLDTSYLRYPTHQTIQILPPEYSSYITKAANLAEALKYTCDWIHTGWKNEYLAFYDIEVGKIRRTIDWMLSKQKEEELMKNRFNFYKFINEHDKRRNTNFLKTFPELEDFYNDCSKIIL